MIHSAMAPASGHVPARARNGRAGAEMGEYGDHARAPHSAIALASGHVPVRARNGRAGARMGEYGGHVWAPVPK